MNSPVRQFHKHIGRHMSRAALAGLVGLVALAITPQFSMSAEAPLAEKPFAIIQVSGAGSANAAPDLATVSLGVLRVEKTARAALDANNKAMAAVIAAMKEGGVEARDLQTSGFSIQPNYVYPKSSENEQNRARIVGYTVSNQLAVRVRDLSRLGQLLDSAVTLGVNTDGGISFGNDKPDTIIATARTLAVKDAVGRAETLASAAGVRLGNILAISEGTPRNQPLALSKARSFDASAEAVPVETGESSYSVNVQVTFEILQ